MGKLLKKNNVAADVVSMGETDDNQVSIFVMRSAHIRTRQVLFLLPMKVGL